MYYICLADDDELDMSDAMVVILLLTVVGEMAVFTGITYLLHLLYVDATEAAQILGTREHAIFTQIPFRLIARALSRPPRRDDEEAPAVHQGNYYHNRYLAHILIFSRDPSTLWNDHISKTLTNEGTQLRDPSHGEVNYIF